MSQLSHAAKNMEICQDAHATRADGNKRFPLAKYRAVGLIWKITQSQISAFILVLG